MDDMPGTDNRYRNVDAQSPYSDDEMDADFPRKPDDFIIEDALSRSPSLSNMASQEEEQDTDVSPAVDNDYLGVRFNDFAEAWTPIKEKAKSIYAAHRPGIQKRISDIYGYYDRQGRWCVDQARAIGRRVKATCTFQTRQARDVLNERLEDAHTFGRVQKAKMKETKALAQVKLHAAAEYTDEYVGKIKTLL
jgi:hypothetical protein